MANGEVSVKENKGKLSFRVYSDVCMLALFIPTLLVINIFGASMSYRSATSAVSELLPETAAATAQAVENKLEMYTELLNEISSGIPSDEELSEDESARAERLAFLNEKKNAYGFSACNYYTLDGISEADGKDYSSTGFFEEAASGKTYISEPSKFEGFSEKQVVMAVPVWENGAGSDVKGILAVFLPQDFLAEALARANLSDGSSIYIIDKSGAVISDINAQDENLRALSEINSELNELYNKAISGETGGGTYKNHGAKRLAAYSPIIGTDSWTIFLSSSQSDYTALPDKLIFIFIGITIVFLLFGVWGINRFINKTADPINKSAHRIALMATGDFDSPVADCISPAIELHTLTDSLNELRLSTSSVIQDMT